MQANETVNYSNDVSSRVKLLIDSKFENPKKFAEAVKVSPSVIYNIIGGRKTNPSFELLSSFATVVPDLNLNWLLNGNGEPFNRVEKGNYLGHLEEPLPNYYQSNAKMIGIMPSLASVRFFPDMMVSAGYAEMLASNQTEMLPVSFSPTSEEVKKGVAVKVYGDSMEPSISEGAIVFLMPLTQAEWLRISKGVFLFDTESTLTIKRIAQNNLLGTPATITLQADNPKYPNLSFNAESINAIWKVTQILNQPVL